MAKERIFCSDFLMSNSSVGIISGSLASGKTSVAVGLAGDPDIRAAYSDGIIWINCGVAMTPHALLVTVNETVRSVQQSAHEHDRRLRCGGTPGPPLVYHLVMHTQCAPLHQIVHHRQCPNC